MWNEDELMKELNSYFDNTTKEQFLKDLKDAGCLNYIKNEDSIIVLPKVEKYIKVVFDYGKCPECGFDLIKDNRCLKCENKNF
jgi:hypothetical protein